MKTTAVCVVLAAMAAIVVSSTAAAEGSSISRGTVTSADGLEIAFVTAGRGDAAVLFIHGGFADLSFWNHQIASLSDRFRVVAMDMAGHGGSGRNRERWSLAAMGLDVRAVVDTLGLQKVVLVGNSMGGPVALEAARIMPKRVIGVIGIDTLHDATESNDEEGWEAYVQAWRQDYGGTCGQMVKRLFHPDADAELVEDVRRRMCDTEPPVPVGVLEIFKGYDLGEAMAAVKVPVRSINGDLYPTNIEGNRKFADYDAVVMEHMGHYPMLEKPEEFERLLVAMLAELGLPRK